MAGASNVLDPVEAARDGISRSKHLIASTLEDLSQHHSWLESYHRDERRRAERLRREDALRRLELKRQRAAWHTRRAAAASYASTRATVEFLKRNGTAFVIWAAPRARAGGQEAWRLSRAGSAWSWRTGSALARDGFALAEHAFARSVRASEVGGIVFRRHARIHSQILGAQAAELSAPAARRAKIGWTRTRYRARRFAFKLETSLSHGWSKTQSAVSRWMVEEAPALRHALAREAAAAGVRTRVGARNLARAGLKTSASLWSRTRSRAYRLLEKPASTQHRALILRPCTALICVEPRRAGLPSILAS